MSTDDQYVMEVMREALEAIQGPIVPVPRALIIQCVALMEQSRTAMEQAGAAVEEARTLVAQARMSTEVKPPETAHTRRRFRFLDVVIAALARFRATCDQAGGTPS